MTDGAETDIEREWHATPGGERWSLVSRIELTPEQAQAITPEALGAAILLQPPATVVSVAYFAQTPEDREKRRHRVAVYFAGIQAGGSVDANGRHRSEVVHVTYMIQRAVRLCAPDLYKVSP